MCSNDHRFLVREEVERTGIVPRAIILEPVARNTAAAVAVAALYLERHEVGAVLAVLPADHVLKDANHFIESVKYAAEVAALGKLVLFGITQLASLEPGVLGAAEMALAGAKEDLGFLRLDGRAFASAPDVSVDRAVMERTSAAAEVPFDGEWSDLGSWSSLWAISPHDEFGNCVLGDALLEDTRDCYVHSENALVVTLGVRDLVIVDTPDTLLVADRGRTQDLSTIVTRLRQSNRKEHQQHLRNVRPWGHFES